MEDIMKHFISISIIFSICILITACGGGGGGNGESYPWDGEKSSDWNQDLWDNWNTTPFTISGGTGIDSNLLGLWEFDDYDSATIEFSSQGDYIDIWDDDETYMKYALKGNEVWTIMRLEIPYSVSGNKITFVGGTFTRETESSGLQGTWSRTYTEKDDYNVTLSFKEELIISDLGITLIEYCGGTINCDEKQGVLKGMYKVEGNKIKFISHSRLDFYYKFSLNKVSAYYANLWSNSIFVLREYNTANSTDPLPTSFLDFNDTHKNKIMSWYDINDHVWDYTKIGSGGKSMVPKTSPFLPKRGKLLQQWYSTNNSFE